jgi:hypothetical protein
MAVSNAIADKARAANARRMENPLDIIVGATAVSKMLAVRLNIRKSSETAAL